MKVVFFAIILFALNLPSKTYAGTNINLDEYLKKPEKPVQCYAST